METNTPDQLDPLIGANIKRIRLMNELTLGDLGKFLGVSPQQMSKYESGVDRIKASSLMRLAIYLGVNIGDFYEGATALIQTGSYKVELSNPKERSLILYYRKTGEMDQFHILNMVKSIAQAYSKTGGEIE